VGRYRANAFGLFDTVGNVEVWTEDCGVEDYDSAPSDGSAQQSPNCERHTLRGSSWNFSPTGFRSAHREEPSDSRPQVRYKCASGRGCPITSPMIQETTTDYGIASEYSSRLTEESHYLGDGGFIPILFGWSHVIANWRRITLPRCQTQVALQTMLLGVQIEVSSAQRKSSS